MLTRKQYELLRFIHERLKEAGVPPSFDEMKDALDLRSKSGIHRLITALEERGFIRRLPHGYRTVLLTTADAAAPAALRAALTADDRLLRLAESADPMVRTLQAEGRVADATLVATRRSQRPDLAVVTHPLPGH